MAPFKGCPVRRQKATGRTGETCALPAGFRTRHDVSWRFEVDLKAARLCFLLALAAAVVPPTAASAQQPSELLTPGIPAKPDDPKGAGVPSVPPLPDTTKRAISTPAEKPVTPAQQPAKPVQ
jgi:hypothetical protein